MVRGALGRGVVLAVIALFAFTASAQGLCFMAAPSRARSSPGASGQHDCCQGGLRAAVPGCCHSPHPTDAGARVGLVRPLTIAPAPALIAAPHPSSDGRRVVLAVSHPPPILRI